MTTPTRAASQTIKGADGVEITFASAGDTLRIRYQRPPSTSPQNPPTVFLALGDDSAGGSAILPFAEKMEGSTVFLPFRANRFYALSRKESWQRKWQDWKWTDPSPSSLAPQFDGDAVTLSLPKQDLPGSGKLKLAIYSKDFAHKSWGWFFGACDPATTAGEGDKYIPHFLELDLRAANDLAIMRRSRLDSAGERLRIYQLFVRLFSNTNETRKPNGTLAENGVGKFNQINDAALSSLREMGFSHVWLTGVLQQATGTDYSKIGQPADDADLLKGVAGSPYAIKDYFDVCPDYAEKPEQRIDEFKALLERVHRHQLKALIDFVPNHVARSYASDVKPEFDFGAKGQNGKGDDSSKFFDPQNNFFYLPKGEGGPPLRLPTVQDGKAVSPTCLLPGMKCDGLFAGEQEHGRVTGNNSVTWTPGLNDWYETVKLNYGFDFTAGDTNVREYPHAGAPNKSIPDTWKKMDQVLAYWQALGVDGFRCDMAHMEPPEFWHWAMGEARKREPAVVFIAEAYDNDPAKVPGSDPVAAKLHGGRSNVMFDLLNAGFNAVYDDPTYKTLKRIVEGPAWCNDIDEAQPDEFIFDNSLRYAENHDEVRLAAKSQWGGHGLKVGPAISAILYGLSRGPAMLYNGQEVGEPASGVEGFGNDDARTSIFDYWSMPELAKWTNGHAYDGAKLSPGQKEMRAFYGRLLRVANEPAFRDGGSFRLNAANKSNEKCGRLGGESASGHWLYSFLRYDAESGQRFLVVVNLNPTDTLKDVTIVLGGGAIDSLGLTNTDPKTPLTLSDRLAASDPTTATSCISEASSTGIWIGDIPAATPLYLEIAL